MSKKEEKETWVGVSLLVGTSAKEEKLRFGFSFFGCQGFRKAKESLAKGEKSGVRKQEGEAVKLCFFSFVFDKERVRGLPLRG